MTKKLEMKFLTGLKKDFKRHEHYFYKIPDSPTATRFMIAKPFDCFIGIGGGLGGMEAKYMDTAKSKNVNIKDLRETQHEGLKHIIKFGGQAWVFYQVKFGRELRLYFWEYREFLRLCEKYASKRAQIIPISILREMPHILGVKNRFDVLEYNLALFERSWEIIGDLYATN